MTTLRDKQLRQLGIPQWKQRGVPTAALTPQDPSALSMIQMRWRSSPVGLCISEADADKTLLTAMLNATQCEWEHLDAPLETLPKLPFSVIFGLSNGQALLPELQLSHSDLHETLELPSGPVLVTHSISEVLANALLKKPVWNALQKAMSVWHAS